MFKLFFVSFLVFSLGVFADDLSYKDRSNSGETKYERIEKLEGYLTKLSKNLGDIHKKMDSATDAKLKKLEEKLKSEWRSDVKKLETMIAESKITNYVKKEDTNSIQAEVDLFNNKIIELKEKIKQLNLEVTTLKEISQ